VPGPIEETRYELRVRHLPEVVIAALIDFTPRRPLIWPETSHPNVYRLHRLHATDAEVTEGLPFSWSRERYDWSEPGVVTLTQLDSNVARDGLIRYDITPVQEGSRIVCTRSRAFYGTRARIAGTVMTLIGARLLKAQLRRGIERFVDIADRGSRTTG
jgi:hypothetical protein